MKKTYMIPECKVMTESITDIITTSQNVDCDIMVSVSDDFWGE